MASIVTIELGFGQQVAAEALKNVPTPLIRCKNRYGGIVTEDEFPVDPTRRQAVDPHSVARSESYSSTRAVSVRLASRTGVETTGLRLLTG